MFNTVLFLLQCDWFVDVTWVDASGTVRTSAKGSEEARALCGGLGLLGTITEFTLQMTETTNTWFSTWYLKDDTNMAEDIDKMLQVCAHASPGPTFNWTYTMCMLTNTHLCWWRFKWAQPLMRLFALHPEQHLALMLGLIMRCTCTAADTHVC
jgi:FAD/FMN-containing dehydrogenase